VAGVFEAAAAHDAHQAPAHQELKIIMNPHMVELVVCDFDCMEKP